MIDEERQEKKNIKKSYYKKLKAYEVELLLEKAKRDKKKWLILQEKNK